MTRRTQAALRRLALSPPEKREVGGPPAYLKCRYRSPLPVEQYDTGRCPGVVDVYACEHQETEDKCILRKVCPGPLPFTVCMRCPHAERKPLSAAPSNG